jgi:DNA replication protein DnaC
MDSEPNHAATIAESLARLVAAAPVDTDSGPAPKRAGRASYVLESSGWGDRYIPEIELRGAEWLATLEIARPIIATGGIIAMVGGRGPGKTQMAAELARGGEWPEDKTEYSRAENVLSTHRRKTALYRRAMDVFLELRHAQKDHVKSSEKEVLEKLANVGLLVIDEFQERGESEWENRIVKNMIDKRYSCRRPTIIIANLSRKELFAQLGASIIDRATENGKSIEFNWPSFRGAQP